MYFGTILMIAGGVGLAACLIWITVDSAGRARRRRGYAEQAAQAVQAVAFSAAPVFRTTAAITRSTADVLLAQRGTATGTPASTSFCPACGTPLPAGAAFCRNCGRAIPSQQQPLV